VLGLFQEQHASFDYGQIAKLLKKIGQATQKDISHTTVIENLYLPILSQMKKYKFKAAQELLLALQDSV